MGGSAMCANLAVTGDARRKTSVHELSRSGSPTRVDAEPRLDWSAMIKQGDKAPAFALPDQDGEKLKLSDLKGRPVVLYFYPRADTPGCTKQACGVRDHQRDYAKFDAEVLGVSPDTVAKVKRFHDKQGLNFTLLADEDHAVAEKYGVWVEKSMYGKKYFGNERTTFVIDGKGSVGTSFARSSRPSTTSSCSLRSRSCSRS